jgi:leucyl aminopeptidase
VTTLTLADADPAQLDTDAVVVGVYSADGGGIALAPGAAPVAAAFGEGALLDALRLVGATGTAGEVTKLATFGAITAPVVAAVGLGAPPGDGGEVPDETVRRAAGAAVRALAGHDRVALALPGALRSLGEGALLGAYRFAGYKTRNATERRPAVRTVTLVAAGAATAGLDGGKADGGKNDGGKSDGGKSDGGKSDGAKTDGGKSAKAEIKRIATVIAAVDRARDWVNAAPNELGPPQFATAIAEEAAKVGLAVEVLDEKALRRGGYGGILAVGLGSALPPRFVRLSYTHAAATNRVALVGKGITFDTGGVSIKPAAGMWEMKSDMAGAAAVAATMTAIAALKPKLTVTAYLPIAENMPSGSAYRPGDVLTMFDGSRVEVLNTDAEGRLILADAIGRACLDGTDYLVEVSTLTGGQVIALGNRVAGVMGSPQLCERICDIGDRVGEPAWPMPLPDDVRKGMDSEVADISQVNSSMDRSGHMLQGGIFLSTFVPDDLPWAHVDIAGPAYHSGEPTGYLPKGGTGVPVRTLIALLEDIAANG